ncbi:MAG: sugar kinase [Bacteroidetes bacterium RIFOXYA12_FULL_35_11]|nr:MAG: sugar kinase [Bacteroidetes bacterium GWF2_35_48]OFY74812.1 MAG: sugar kinase [Bacteroidetes bacterium RIFOXYA12_FULL_35_11]OFY97938.1 MAG: sugar kinase [Bacteroidetes bacterium RIFOXYC12_FULL_35_7]HBX52467.1 adenosine kinase [Bacteroidales bacterium]
MKILGIGNALVDTMVKLENDSVLKDFNFPKGSMQLVEKEVVVKLNDVTSRLKKSLSSGGSVANAIHGLAKLGIHAGYIGKIGEDDTGRAFQNDMNSVDVNTKMLKSSSLSGQAMVLVSPDSERTFAVYLGAAIELSADDLKSYLFDGFDLLMIEGYLVQNHNLILQAAKMAKSKNMKIAIDLASYNVVQDNLDFIKNLVKEFADIVFANEEEAKAFTGKEPEEALNDIASVCDIAVVKIGKNGSMIKAGNNTYNVGVISVESNDTTGAGDLYASGFLYGLAKGLGLEKCGKIGAICSGNVIEVVGSKMDEARWSKIRNMIREIEK